MRIRTIVLLALVLLFGMDTGVLAAVSGGDEAAPTNAVVDQAMKALRARNPERYQKIMALREEDPAAFSQNVLEVSREQERLARLRKQIPENYQPQVAMWNNREKLKNLVEEYRTEEDKAGRQIIESQIDNLLGEQFELRRQMRANRLKRAEKKLAEMKQELRQDPSADRLKFVSQWKPKLLDIRPKALAKQAKKAQKE